MRIIIEDDYEKMSKAAADIIADMIRAKPDCVIGLATGSTPIGTYKELARMHKEENLDFSDVKTFNLDEYLGIGMEMSKPYETDQSYARFMYEELFKHVNLKKENIYVPDGLTKEPENFCLWYESEIKRCGGIDIQLLGIGGDGHWAFNEPGSSLASRTRVQALSRQTLEDNFNSFYSKAKVKKEDMPHFAITMGVGTILEAKHALMIVNGINKAGIVAEALEGYITSKVTASAIQLHPGKVTVILDKPASSKLTWSIEKN
ncbi:MAG TPA: glucosamine-6-phosphate deaminase [Actinobacteria bacterium]|jgi:glucosamine-6-phosphate deaminase|nr:glucosamine-6-phosphate deaminase [Actinomycetota bacterium]